MVGKCPHALPSAKKQTKKCASHRLVWRALSRRAHNNFLSRECKVACFRRTPSPRRPTPSLGLCAGGCGKMSTLTVRKEVIGIPPAGFDKKKKKMYVASVGIYGRRAGERRAISVCKVACFRRTSSPRRLAPYLGQTLT